MMKRRNFLFLSAAAILPVVAQPKGAKLVVHITYEGSGAWDKTHTMGCAIWKDLSFTTNQAEKPLEHTVVDPMTKTTTFEDVTTSPVYVTCLLNATGTWDGMSSPVPEDSFVGSYGEPGAAKAVELAPGKTTTISMTWG